MNFGQAIASGWKNYANSKDRASRSEYWYWRLFTFLVGVGIAFFRGVLVTSGRASAPELPFVFLQLSFSVAVILPSICLDVRRLHDTGRSGWWCLLSFTIIGIIPLTIWYCQPGQPGANKYGRNPLEPKADAVV